MRSLCSLQWHCSGRISSNCIAARRQHSNTAQEKLFQHSAAPPKSNAIKILPDDHNSKNDGPSLRQGLRLPVAIASHMEAYFHALSPEWRCGDPMVAGSLPAATMTLSGSA